jgi:hypothetical protein
MSSMKCTKFDEKIITSCVVMFSKTSCWGRLKNNSEQLPREICHLALAVTLNDGDKDSIS